MIPAFGNRNASLWKVLACRVAAVDGSAQPLEPKGIPANGVPYDWGSPKCFDLVMGTVIKIM